jgi:ubiquinone biosynthesis protein COQ9
MSELERSEERDAALRAMLPHIAAHGWTTTALRAGLAEREASAQAASYLFSGPLDMIEAYLDFADRRMAAAAADLPQTRLSERIRAIVALRFAQAREERDASRRAAAVLALPTSAAVSARSLARTVDAIWHAAGDEAADFSWYTKRATLAGVYAATLLFWLRLDSYADPDDGQTLSFLDRRLAEIARVAKLKARLQRQIESLLPAGWRGSTIPEPVHG